MSCEAREFDCAFHCFRTAVRKKHAIEAGKLAETLGKPSLVFVVVEIRDVNQLRRLIANRLHDSRMRVAERVHAQSGNEVQIFPALEVVQENALPALKGDWVTVVGRKKKALFEIGNLLQIRH